jgi:hypothetical protein
MIKTITIGAVVFVLNLYTAIADHSWFNWMVSGIILTMTAWTTSYRYKIHKRRETWYK